MFLKRIVLHGFKSFADRTEFDFGSGRTAIVGPNGCGKSNVLDAVRWVLGEQSARTLRGSKMMDIIFAGSRSRKPANCAEVSLVFDNRTQFLACDEAEVVVGRMLYRNGDSEYRLNGKRCRMKDVRDLLLDTGVGVDAYSVIEQGRVDAMLQASPIERRELFEEAAGISRYRIRRAEAQRKLERTQNNLLRLDDVIEELERRLRSVKVAAGKARNFQEYDRRLRELRSAFSLAEYDELERKLISRREQVRVRTDEVNGRRVELARLDADAAELQHSAESLDGRIQQAEESLRALETEESALAERLKQGGRRLEELGETRARRQEHARQAEQQAADVSARIDEGRRELAELVEQEQRQNQLVAEIDNQRAAGVERLDQARASIESERSAAFQAARHASRQHNELENLLRQSRQLEARRATLADRRKEVEEQTAGLDQRKGELERRAAQLDHDSNEVAGEIRSAEGSLDELREQVEQIGEQIADLRQQRSGLVSQLELLEEMERRQEGVGRGARWLLDWRGDGDEQPGTVIGLVADVLHIDDPRVDALAEMLSRFEHLVVVRDGYDFLAELARRGEQPGPVGIVALDRLSDAALPTDYSDSPGFVTCASDWVRCDEQYRPLAKRLLGRTIVVDVVERAMALAQAAPDGYVFVTLDGVAVESGGRMTVGVTKALTGLISRKAQIRKLRGDIDEVETQIEASVRGRSEIERRVSDGELQRESLMQRIAVIQKQHADVCTEQMRLGDEVARVEREAMVLRDEDAELARSLEESRRQARQVELEHAVSEEARQDHESRIAELENTLRGMEAIAAGATRELTEARISVGRAAERREARQHSVDELDRRLEALRAAMQQAEREADEADRRIAAAEQERVVSQTRQAALSGEIAERRDDVMTLRAERQDARQRFEACSAAVRGLHAKIEELDGGLRECEVALRETEVRKDELISRVAEELSIDLAALYREYEQTDQDWDAIRAEIEELRGKISRLGNVNLDAIDELEELTPRHDNLTTQRDDLIVSVGRLQKLIEELDTESTTRFVACFEEVREGFQELFRKLFGGGKADAILEDPERPLECGIEIIARPPGKEPRSISLLSGGEKTMTAVALLFAVFKRKPSPFAILDEVDAALDESNIDRFNNMLNDFLAQSQFVLITHSKRTMQTAEVLYGVTMEEPGVSKRVSVRFDDRVDTPNVA